MGILELPSLDVAVVSGHVSPHWQQALLRGLNNAANHWNMQLRRLSAAMPAQNPAQACADIDGILLRDAGLYSLSHNNNLLDDMVTSAQELHPIYPVR